MDDGYVYDVAAQLWRCLDRGIPKAMDRFLDAVVRFKCVDRELKVSYCRILQEIYKRRYDEGATSELRLLTGSSYEGMPSEVCGDVDMMYTNKAWPVVVCEPPGDTPSQGYLIAHMNRVQPAFVTLQLIPDINYHDDINNAVVEVPGSDDSPSVRCLGNTKFVTELYKDDDSVECIHGPAGTGLLNRRVPERGMGDQVSCLTSPSWPTCASEFTTRPRPHGWPSRSLVDKIQQAGCHLVAVGHPDNRSTGTEWRWSFSMAEKDLIHDMSDTEAGVMFLLKAIKNKHWSNDDTDAPTTFCSYFIKTGCVWVCEETDHSNMATMDLCRLVIDWLVTCYKTRRLPHYFIPKQNLIGHLSQELCGPVVRWLEGVRNLPLGARLGQHGHAESTRKPSRIDIEQIRQP